MKTGSELKLFIENTLTDVNSSLPQGYELKNQEEAEVYFELAGTTTKAKDGKIDFQIVGVKGEHSNEDTAVVSFGVGKKSTPAEDAKQVVELLKGIASNPDLQAPTQKKKEV